MTAHDTRSPPIGPGPLARREQRLAYAMLAPTFLMVFSVVLFPLLANFWISLKPVTLGDLRPPTLQVNERLREANGRLTLDYRLRNPSPTGMIGEAGFADTIPEGLRVLALDPRCSIDAGRIACRLGDLPPASRESLTITLERTQAAGPTLPNPRDSEPSIFGTSENVLTSLDFTLDNFRRAFDDETFWNVLWVTITYTLFGTLGALLLGLFAAQIMTSEFKGRGILRGLFLFPYVAPVMAVAFTWLILLDPFSGTFNALLQRMGLIETAFNFLGTRSAPISLFGFSVEVPVALATVTAFEAWRYFPLAFLFILARMQAVPRDMYEAADIDGATPIQQFLALSLPQLAGVMATLFLLRFIWTFNKFDDIFLLTGGNAGTRTLTVDVYEQGFALSNRGAGAAVAVVVFLMLVLFVALFFRLAPQENP